MVKVLKAKYFLTSSFIGAKGRPNDSYTWRSIISARDLLMKRVSINIWTDPWIPSLPNFRVSSLRGREVDGPDFVNELIIDKSWNSSLLSYLFSHEEAKAIKEIFIPFFDQVDAWVWHYTKDGSFKVKSAYFIELMSKSNVSGSSASHTFDNIWRSILFLPRN